MLSNSINSRKSINSRIPVCLGQPSSVHTQMCFRRYALTQRIGEAKIQPYFTYVCICMNNTISNTITIVCLCRYALTHRIGEAKIQPYFTYACVCMNINACDEGICMNMYE